MRVVAAFAAGRDDEAIRHLHIAAGQPRWDDHAHDEVRAQWKLLVATYGERGALQKLPSIGGQLYPHLAQIREVARLAVWRAGQRERVGDHAAARSLRHDVMRLGLRMEADSASLIDKLVGRSLFQIGTQPMPPDPPRQQRLPNRDPGRDLWRERREHYVALLEQQGAVDEASWVRSEGRRLDERYHPFDWDLTLSTLARLQAWWGIGVALLRQIIALMVLWTVAFALARFGARTSALNGRTTRVAWWLTGVALIMGPCLLVAPVGNVGLLDAGLLLGLVLAGLMALALALAAGRTAVAVGTGRVDARPRWSPGLVALVSVLPAAILLFMTARLSEHTISGGIQVYPFTTYKKWIGVQPSVEWNAWLPVLVLIPTLGLGFLVLCRVAALGLPLFSGFARGLRRAIPPSLAILTTLYLAAVPLAVTADRALTYQMEQMLADELRYLRGQAPGK